MSDQLEQGLVKAQRAVDRLDADHTLGLGALIAALMQGGSKRLRHLLKAMRPATPKHRNPPSKPRVIAENVRTLHRELNTKRRGHEKLPTSRRKIGKRIAVAKRRMLERGDDVVFPFKGSPVRINNDLKRRGGAAARPRGGE